MPSTTKAHLLPVDVTVSEANQYGHRKVQVKIQGVGTLDLTRFFMEGGKLSYWEEFQREVGLETLIAQAIEQEAKNSKNSGGPSL